MNLTKKQMLKFWQRAVYLRIHSWNKRRQPKFKLTQIVQVVTNEPDMGTWTYMDSVRRERKGKRGIIVDMGALPDSDVPEKYSNYDYSVMFPDGKTIVFTEEHLTRAR